jgi:hypothetical protein
MNHVFSHLKFKVFTTLAQGDNRTKFVDCFAQGLCRESNHTLAYCLAVFDYPCSFQRFSSDALEQTAASIKKETRPTRVS